MKTTTGGEYFVRDPSGVTRRRVLGGAAALAAGAVIGMPRVVRAKPERMTIPNPGGALEAAYRAAYFETFTQQTGIAISGAPYIGAGKIKAMVENNAVDVDVVSTDATEAAVAAREGLLEPIDYGVVDKSRLIDKAAQEYYLLPDVAGSVMTWSTQAFDAETRPKDWTEFFDTEAKPGIRSLWKLAAQTLELAAMGGGQPRDKLYPIDVDLAFATLDKIRDDIIWWESGAQGAQLLIGGEADVGMTWNGRVYEPKKQGAPVDYTFDHCLYVSDALVVPKGAKNKKWAMEFLANVTEAKNQATFSKNIPYGPTNPAAFELLDDARKAELPNSPQNARTAVFQDFEYWADHGDQLFARFNQWLIG